MKGGDKKRGWIRKLWRGGGTMPDFSVGEIVKLKLTGQSAQVLGRMYSRFETAYLLRITSLNTIILGEEEIEKIEEPEKTKEE